MTSALNTALTGTVTPGLDSCASPVVSGRDRPPVAFTSDAADHIGIISRRYFEDLPIAQRLRVGRAVSRLRWDWESAHRWEWEAERTNRVVRHLANIAAYATGGVLNIWRVPSQCWMCQRVIAGAMCSRCLSHVQSNGTEEERHGNA